MRLPPGGLPQGRAIRRARARDILNSIATMPGRESSHWSRRTKAGHRDVEIRLARRVTAPEYSLPRRQACAANQEHTDRQDAEQLAEDHETFPPLAPTGCAWASVVSGFAKKPSPGDARWATITRRLHWPRNSRCTAAHANHARKPLTRIRL